MKKLWAVIIKEALVFIRDIPGLLLLFLMPMLLVIVVTLTQEKALNQKDNRIDILLIDHDTSDISRTIEKGLIESKYFNVIKYSQPDEAEEQEIKNSIASGQYQIGIFLPKGASQLAVLRSQRLIQLTVDNPKSIKDSIKSKSGISGLTIFFDPAIKEAYKNSVLSSLRMLIQGAEIKIMVSNFFGVLQTEINKQFKEKMLSYTKKDIKINIPDFAWNQDLNKQLKETIQGYAKEDVEVKMPEFPWEPESLVQVQEKYAHKEVSMIKPSVVQNNVPGFALFAMFFIVIPLAGSIISERNEGAYNRLRTLPVNYTTFWIGKIVVYQLVCLLQFAFMLVVGLYIIPLFNDMPALVIGNSYFSIFITAFTSALAAIGFGMLIGTLASTHGQAATFGSVMIVILAILGGSFIPVYLMSPNFKIISQISPLRWGIEAFLDLFVRNGNFTTVFPSLLKLFGFFTVSVIIASFNYVRRN